MTRLPRARLDAAVCLALAVPAGAAAPAAALAQVVHGQVVDSITRGAVAGGVVTLMSGVSAAVDSAVTDARGLFLLRAPSGGRYHLRVRHRAYRESRFPPFRARAGEVLTYVLPVASITRAGATSGPEIEGVIARLCPAGLPDDAPVVAGFVRNATTENPVPGARISVTLPVLAGVVARPRAGDVVRDVVVGADGLYAVCGAPAGRRLDIHAARGAASSRFVTITLLKNGVIVNGAFHEMRSRLWRQDLDLLPATRHRAAVRGTVIERDGRPVRNAQVRLAGSRHATRTGRDGAFSMDGLPSGEARLEVTRNTHRPLTRHIRLVAGTVTDLTEPGTLVMSAVPLRLEEIAIAGGEPSGNPWIPEFVDRRRREPGGAFLTASQYEERWGTPTSIVEMLYALRGVRPGGAPAAGGAGHAAPRLVRCGADRFPVYYLDGLYIGWGGETDLDAAASAAWIGAIEAYYESPSRLQHLEGPRPREACGAVYLWTR